MDRRIRLLHVDDDPDFLGMTAEYLERADESFEVVSEPSVAAGLDRLDDERFDCVVSDYQFPEGDGLAFLDAVRDRYPDLPFLLFTGHGSEAVASEALTRGATDYLQKDRGTDQFRLLANRIDNAVAARVNRRELERYRTLVETVGDPMYVLDAEGRVTLANDAMGEMLECDPETVVGTHASTFMTEDDFERGTEVIVDLLDDPERDWATYEVTVRASTGRDVPAEINVSPLLDEGGNYLATIGVVRDLSEREHRQQRLHALHETTRELMAATEVEEAARIAVDAAEGVLDLEMATFFARKPGGEALAPLAVTETTREIVGQPSAFEAGSGLIWAAFERGEPLFAADVREHEAVHNPDTPIRSELSIPAGDHGIFVASSTTIDDFDRTDEELANVLVSNLTTAIDAIRREGTLRERERELQRYETMLEMMGDGVYAMDTEGNYIDFNEQLAEMVGYDRETIFEEGPSLWFDEGQIARFERAIRRLLENDETSVATVEATAERADGDVIDAEVNLSLLTDENGSNRGTVGVVRDVSERKERERELEQYEAILQASPDEIYTLDLEGRFTLSVPPTESATTRSGYAPEDLIGQHVSTVMDESDIERGEALVRDLVTSGDRTNASFEMDVITKSGERLPHENHIALLADDDGTVQGTVGILRDISERKRRERELQRQNERLESFARIASHDLRNPLSIAAGRLELAREECESDHLSSVADALARMERLIEDTLTMARGGRTVTDKRPLDLGRVLPDWWTPVATDRATLQVDDPVTVEADPDRLRQVFENLFRNAVEHGGPGVTVRVGAVDGGFYVEDDGPGIPSGEISDVFEPGNTTAADGTGFGLAIVEEIVEAHDWEIHLTSSESGGTRFEITGVDESS